MLDRFPARLSIVHMVPRVASERGVDHLPILAEVGLDGHDPHWDRQVVARARIAALLALLARKAGDEALGLDLASAADPVALGPAGLALGIGRTLARGWPRISGTCPPCRAVWTIGWCRMGGG